MTQQDNQGPQGADWPAVEREYRAGIRTLRAIGADYGITEGAIRKRAARHEWSRDLRGKIQAKAEDKVRKETVRKEAVRKGSTQRCVPTEARVVEVNAEVVAQADLLNRADVVRALDSARDMLEELALLGRRDFAGVLEALVQENEDTERPGGDKRAELFRYILSLPGRVKMAKELAGTFGVYIPLQRKILKLDTEAKEKESELDALLKRINGSEG